MLKQPTDFHNQQFVPNFVTICARGGIIHSKDIIFETPESLHYCLFGSNSWLTYLSDQRTAGS